MNKVKILKYDKRSHKFTFELNDRVYEIELLDVLKYELWDALGIQMSKHYDYFTAVLEDGSTVKENCYAYDKPVYNDQAATLIWCGGVYTWEGIFTREEHDMQFFNDKYAAFFAYKYLETNLFADLKIFMAGRLKPYYDVITPELKKGQDRSEAVIALENIKNSLLDNIIDTMKG